MVPAPEVSVIVPYFDDQARLTLLLRALAQQTGGVPFDVIVADDGSPQTPSIPTGLGFSCTVVRQPDAGFRAAAARNLGAGRATADRLLFLDGDTMPTPGYVAAMDARLRAVDDGAGALVVGRRRHADLSGVTPDAALRFLRGAATEGVAAEGVAVGVAAAGVADDGTAGDGVADDGAAGPGDAGVAILPEPAWLAAGYARTGNLARAGDEDFRLVISAVLGLDRRLWQATGGFDESFVGYGGEDWDLAWRSRVAGASWAYEPAAVAWHDGPDAAGRGQPAEGKNAESLRLARSVPLPSVRGRGLVLPQPAIVVRYTGPTTGTAADAPVVACIAGLLSGADASVWFVGPAAPLPPLLADDPRVHTGAVPPAVVARAGWQVTVHRPLRLADSLETLCAAGECERPGWLTVHHTRARNRAEPMPHRPAPAVTAIPREVGLERWWGGW